VSIPPCVSYVVAHTDAPIQIFDLFIDYGWNGIQFITWTMVVNGIPKIVFLYLFIHQWQHIIIGYADNHPDPHPFGVFKSLIDLVCIAHIDGTYRVSLDPVIRAFLVKLLDILFATIHRDRKSTRLNSSHVKISYAVFCLKKKT